jgi:hypothetical protein
MPTADDREDYYWQIHLPLKAVQSATSAENCYHNLTQHCTNFIEQTEMTELRIAINITPISVL